MKDLRKPTTTEGQALIRQAVNSCTYNHSHTGAVDVNKYLGETRAILNNRQTNIRLFAAG